MRAGRLDPGEVAVVSVTLNNPGWDAAFDDHAARRRCSPAWSAVHQHGRPRFDRSQTRDQPWSATSPAVFSPAIRHIRDAGSARSTARP